MLFYWSHLNHESSFFFGGIQLAIMLIMVKNRGYCLIRAESEALRLFWRKMEAVSIVLLGSDNEEKDNNADYDKEFMYVFFLFCITALQFIHYYCCIGGCCSTGTEVEAWKFFWGKIEDVALLELNLKHGAFFLMGEIYLVCFFCPNLLCYNLDNYYCCFGGNCLTGTESGVWMLLWSKLENVIQLELNLKHNLDIIVAVLKAVVQLELILKHRNSFKRNWRLECYLTEAESETRQLFSFGRNSFSNNANYDKESRYYYCCFGGCCSTGAESGEWRLFWKKFEDSMEAVVEEIGGFCSTGAESEICQPFSSGSNSFSNNSNYDSKTRGCCSTGTDSEALRFFWKKFEDVLILQLNRKHRSYFVKVMLVTIENPGCCSTGTESEALKLLWRELENVAILQLSLKHESSSVRRTKAETDGLRLFWSKLEAVVQLNSEHGSCCEKNWGLELEDVALLEVHLKRVNFFLLGGIHLEIMLITIKNLAIIIVVLDAVIQLGLNLENEDFSRGNLRIWKLLWEKLEAVTLLELNLKRVNSFLLGGIHLAIMLITIKNPEFRHYYCCFGCCYSTGTESKALMLFWKKKWRLNVIELYSWNNIFSIMDKNILEFKNEHEKIYNICISFLGISKECELEVKSYANYLVKNKIQGFVTLHSYEGFILYPWGYQKKLYTDDRKNLHKLGEEMRNAIENISGADYNVGQSADILYRANGYSNDYAKSLGIKYVFTIEIGSRKMYNFGFIILKSYISKLAEEALAEILVVSQKISKENIVESNIK
uniref:Peptidase M14 domain-containing protein n=1 Tax=Strongyloides stercoralis TaxID=6248 RepID=A0AAF5DSH7_STRER